ncbi:hypothetical protein AABB87_16900 [Roseateles sp. PN1]
MEKALRTASTVKRRCLAAIHRPDVAQEERPSTVNFGFDNPSPRFQHEPLVLDKFNFFLS